MLGLVVIGILLASGEAGSEFILALGMAGSEVIRASGGAGAKVIRALGGAGPEVILALSVSGALRAVARRDPNAFFQLSLRMVAHLTRWPGWMEFDEELFPNDGVNI